MSVITGSDQQVAINVNSANEKNQLENSSTANHGVSRRALLGRASLITTAGVAAPLLASVAGAHEKEGDNERSTSGRDYSDFYRDDQYGTLHAKTLTKKSYKARLKAAELEYDVDIPPHPNNGDEARYPNKIGTSTKGLKHDADGHVDPESYASFLKALQTRKHEDFEKIILGGTAKLADPQGPLTTALEGVSNAQLAIPVAERLDSAALAAEHIEIYWQALLRDVPFSEYRNTTSNPLVLAAVAELNRLPEYRGPKINGQVTPETLFRSTALYVDYQADRSGKKGKYVVPPDTLKGPYISQFLLRPVPAWGTFAAQPQLRPIQTAGESFGTTFDEWLKIRNGISTGRNVTSEAGRRHIINGRDLAWLARVHKVLAKGASYPLHRDVLESDAVARTFAANGSYLLPLANNTGAPTHPGYPSGATISAATPVTLLKAFFDESYVIPNPVQVDPADPTKLIPWDGEPLTLGGELNKLVNNVGFGRNFNGFHTRADISASHALGEALAISLLRDQRFTYNETFAGYSFTRFDGTKITV